MAKLTKDKTTEDLILAAAKKIFVIKGMSGARMQDIADEAGINKALLHYYFRNKEKLFEVIFFEAAGKLFPKIGEILNSDLDLFKKIEKFCDEYITIVMENPYLPLFVLYEINQDPERFFKRLGGGKAMPEPAKFLDQLESEMKKGTIKRVSPLHFMLNIISMTVFPFVAKPLMQKVFYLDELQFRSVMEQRKKEIPKFIIDSIKV